MDNTPPNPFTARQIEAFRLVHVVGVTQEEAGEVMGISQKAVSTLLSRLRKKFPHIFPTVIPRRKFVRYESNKGYGGCRRI